jgi:uncharacterized protein (DUF2249 family)/hemerythrin-like domain-containing protein
MEKTLDVRDVFPWERHERIFAAFRGLAPGESFILINDHEPKPLLYEFQAEHDGSFDWWPLEAGPGAWRVEVVKRKTPDPKRTVTEFFQSDHRRLDSIYGRFSEDVREKRWEEAVEKFRAFRFGLKRHIRIEEDILFPVFEEKTGMREGGPTFVMRGEHKEIQELLDEVLASTEGKNPEGVFRAATFLLQMLADHNMKEENILYPESDAFLTEEERRSVVKRAQAFGPA